MGFGEVANFTAYAFAPASLVTPLGALSVLVAAVLSSRFLNERLNLLGKLGCFLCIIGSTIIVIHSPKEMEIDDLNVLTEKLFDEPFVIYVIIVVIVCLILGLYIGPKYGHQHVCVHILMCSLMGSLTVMSCKALGVAIRDSFQTDKNAFTNWLPYFLAIVTLTLIAIQMNYLNKALDIFNTSIVTPVYYVIFTTFVIIASAILFKEWGKMRAIDVLGDICGFLVVIVAVILLTAFKDMDISLNDVRMIMKPKKMLLDQYDNHQYDNHQYEGMERKNSWETKARYGTNSLEA